MRKFKSIGGADANPENPNHFKFPGLGSPKIDGIRLLEYSSKIVTRSLKDVKNLYTRGVLNEFLAKSAEKGFRGLDGEVTVGLPYAPNVMQATSSGIMSRDGEPDFTWHLFDRYQYASDPFQERHLSLYKLRDLYLLEAFPRVTILEHRLLNNMEELLQYEREMLELGYEGIMFRSLNGHYKLGHSTLREGLLLKVKRFKDDEAVIVGYEPLMKNNNPATINLLGHTERKGGKAGLEPKEMLGSFKVKCPNFEEEFSIGMGKGFTHDIRKELWLIRDSLIGKKLKFSYFPTGIKNCPRFPKFIGVRDEDDMS